MVIPFERRPLRGRPPRESRLEANAGRRIPRFNGGGNLNRWAGATARRAAIAVIIAIITITLLSPQRGLGEAGASKCRATLMYYPMCNTCPRRSRWHLLRPRALSRDTGRSSTKNPLWYNGPPASRARPAHISHGLWQRPSFRY